MAQGPASALSPACLKVLACLRGGKWHAAAAIGERIGRTASDANHLLKRLTEAGLAEEAVAPPGQWPAIKTWKITEAGTARVGPRTTVLPAVRREGSKR